MKLALVLLIGSLCAAQEIRRPTAEADPGSTHSTGCTGSIYTASSAMPFAYDAAGQSTSSTLTMNGSNAGNTLVQFKNRQFKTWQSTTQTYTSLSLNISSSSTGASSRDGTGNACVAYSTNSGSTWTSVRCDASGAGWGQITDTVTLSASQSLATIRVGICAQGSNGIIKTGVLPGGDDVSVFDVWTLGSTTSQPTGGGTLGSGTGQPHRGIVIVN